MTNEWIAAIYAAREARTECNGAVFDLSISHDFEDLHDRFRPQIVTKLENARRFIDIALDSVRNTSASEQRKGET